MENLTIARIIFIVLIGVLFVSFFFALRLQIEEDIEKQKKEYEEKQATKKINSDEDYSV